MFHQLLTSPSCDVIKCRRIMLLKWKVQESKTSKSNLCLNQEILHNDNVEGL